MEYINREPIIDEKIVSGDNRLTVNMVNRVKVEFNGVLKGRYKTGTGRNKRLNLVKFCLYETTFSFGRPGLDGGNNDQRKTRPHSLEPFR